MFLYNIMKNDGSTKSPKSFDNVSAAFVIVSQLLILFVDQQNIPGEKYKGRRRESERTCFIETAWALELMTIEIFSCFENSCVWSISNCGVYPKYEFAHGMLIEPVPLICANVSSCISSVGFLSVIYGKCRIGNVTVTTTSHQWKLHKSRLLTL